MFNRQKRLPALSKLMGDHDIRPATPDELKAKMMAIHTAFGGKNG